ncbi:D5-like helicase-primase [Marseillevirus marseillevirus]|uniref:D5-like helicase-primase n=1 Tax=Marseillevirus marseillevirus TaxID=694581 RepID=D2XB94_GBMV|nr:D5-like helicase-primase [Marseillevirus marseillevirus]ADB04221.1 D5-like helicase-primase [Marseillevirus marseillevirus]
MSSPTKGNTHHESPKLSQAYFAGKLFVNKDFLFSVYKDFFEGNSLIPKRGSCIIAKDINANGAKLCCVFKTRDEAIKFTEKFNPEERNFYEVIPGGVARCPYFDIDAARNGDEEEERGRKILLSTIKEIKYVFFECFGHKLRDEDFSVYTSSTDEKDSFHVYINNYFFANKEESKEFAQRVTSSLEERGEGFEKFLDNNVYSAWQCLRLIGSHKKGKGVDATKREYTDYVKKFVCDLSGCGERSLPHIAVQKKSYVYQVQDIVPTSEKEEKALNALYKLEGAQQCLEYKGMKQTELGWFMNFQMVCPWYCPICEREHDNSSNLNSAYISIGPRNIWLKCRSAASPKKNGDDEGRTKKLLVGRKRKAKGEYLPCLIDTEDPWYWPDFTLYYDGKRYSSKGEMLDELLPGLRRVMAYIPSEAAVVIKSEKSKCFKRHDISFLKKSTVTFFFTEDKSIIPVPLFSLFLLAKKELTTRGVKFYPFSSNEDDVTLPIDYVNTFEGFKAQPVDEFVDMEKIRPLLDHIFEVLADGSKENYEYILSWLSHIVKNPRQKTGVALVLLSESQGAGKGIFTNFLLEKVFGRSLGTCIGDLERVVHRFNSSLDKKLLVVLDEVKPVDAGAYHKTFDTLKYMITEPTLQIERKGIETVEEESYLNFFITTNNSFAVRVEQTDRRYALFRCSDKRVGDEEYFKNFGKSLDQKCANNFLSFLLGFEGMSLRKIPNTPLRQECKTSSKSSIQLFMDEFDASEYETNVDGWIASSDIYLNFVGWSARNGYKNTPNSSVFGKSTNTLFEKKRETRGGKKIVVWKEK